MSTTTYDRYHDPRADEPRAEDGCTPGPGAAACDDGKPRRRWVLGRLFGGWRRRRRLRAIRPRALRRCLRRLELDERQLDLALRARQQLRELDAELARERRALGRRLLALCLDPEQQRDEALRAAGRLGRHLDERGAELCMALADFGETLDPRQRLALKRWLAHG